MVTAFLIILPQMVLPWLFHFCSNPFQVTCHSGRILFTLSTALGNKQDPYGMTVVCYSANKLPIGRKALNSYEILVVFGFAESPGFKALDFLSGRFVKSGYKSFFLFDRTLSGLRS
jgi:hypothetical protein